MLKNNQPGTQTGVFQSELITLENKKLLIANWKAPKHIKTLITTRHGGVSIGSFKSLNLALHVTDNPEHVIKNRQILREMLPSEPIWLNQTHSDNILNIDKPSYNLHDPYDASITKTSGIACVVMTADCIPILLTDTKGSFVAAVHAGWRGVANGIIGKTVKQVAQNNEILAYLGPSISQNSFEVDKDVFDIFTNLKAENRQFLQRSGSGKYLADLVSIAKLQLIDAGVMIHNIWISEYCTVKEQELFFSYRRDNVTGRFASLIWIT